MSAPGSRELVASSASAERLARVVQATVKRNQERRPLDLSHFDDLKIRKGHREALAFMISQLAYIEDEGPRNLGNIARGSPVPLVRAAYEAQVVDEVAHGAMLGQWLQSFGTRLAPHPAAVIGVRVGALLQHHTWVGIHGMTVLTEFYASTLIEELRARVEEPLLLELLEQVQKDEHRHKVIAVESLRVLAEAGADRTFLSRAFGAPVKRSSVSFFRTVFGGFLRTRCGPLDLPHAEILERSLDEAHTALARALAGTPSGVSA